MSDAKYRLVTRSDFDGLVCAVLLNELNLIDEITFVHPKDMQDGKVPITSRDITTNLPYVPGAHLVFDHHESETIRNSGRRDENHIDDLSDAHEMGNDPCREHGCNRSQGRWIEQFCDLLARFRTEQRERPAKGFAYLLRRIHCSDIRRWGNLQRRR